MIIIRSDTENAAPCSTPKYYKFYFRSCIFKDLKAPPRLFAFASAKGKDESTAKCAQRRRNASTSEANLQSTEENFSILQMFNYFKGSIMLLSSNCREQDIGGWAYMTWFSPCGQIWLKIHVGKNAMPHIATWCFTSTKKPTVTNSAWKCTRVCKGALMWFTWLHEIHWTKMVNAHYCHHWVT